MYTKVTLQERLIELIQDKYHVVSKVENENAPFKKVYETQKKVCISVSRGVTTAKQATRFCFSETGFFVCSRRRVFWFTKGLLQKYTKTFATW